MTDPQNSNNWGPFKSPEYVIFLDVPDVSTDEVLKSLASLESLQALSDEKLQKFKRGGYVGGMEG